MNGVATYVSYTVTLSPTTHNGSTATTGVPNGGHKLSVAAIVGGVAGALVGLLLLVAFGVWYKSNKCKKAGAPQLVAVDAYDPPSLGPWSPTLVDLGGPTLVRPSHTRSEFVVSRNSPFLF